MRLVFYGSEHTAPARRMCRWAVDAGHEVTWAGYLGDVIGDSPACHVQIRSNDDPLPELAALVAEVQPHLAHAFNFSFLSGFHIRAGFCPLILSAFGGLNALVSSPHPLNPTVPDLIAGSAATIVEGQLLHDAATQRFPDAAFELICLGVDPDHHKPAPAWQRRDWRSALGLAQDAVVFFSARGIGDGYRQPEILEAFATALPDLPDTSVLLMIALTRGWDRQERVASLKARADALGVRHRVHWLPELRHVMMPGVYGLSDFVINYPVADAFPSTVMEAIACGVPVISANLPAYRGSYIERHCQLVDPTGPGDLVSALVRAVAEPAGLRAARTLAARDDVLRQFPEADQRERLLALYDRVAGTGRS
jgi:glycosyltransferase involved in cell wall biosynthesis